MTVNRALLTLLITTGLSVQFHQDSPHTSPESAMAADSSGVQDADKVPVSETM
jgi:hypothetical protein